MSYRSEEIRTMWLWAIAFAIVVFFLFWIGSSIYTAQKRSLNPEIVKLDNEREKQDQEDRARDKQQYIEGCKQVGKAPGDMSDGRNAWSCK